jgi:hypothetical protein
MEHKWQFASIAMAKTKQKSTLKVKALISSAYLLQK